MKEEQKLFTAPGDDYLAVVYLLSHGLIVSPVPEGTGHRWAPHWGSMSSGCEATEWNAIWVPTQGVVAGGGTWPLLAILRDSA